MLVLVFADLVTRVLFFRNDYPQTPCRRHRRDGLYCGVIPFGWLYLRTLLTPTRTRARPSSSSASSPRSPQTGALIGATSIRDTAIAIGIAQSIAYATGAIIGFT
ncbi:MAG: hypothetical protein IPM00_10630 [Tetrasphaera sp.]|nr:hypothetical protein [Tetrasphaera sp.]